MHIAYEDVLKRLKEERNRICWSQKEMSQCVRMSQSNYSKVELGLRRLNYYELKCLSESDVDLHYIYTGQKGSDRYKDFFCNCSYSELICFISVIYSIVVLRCGKDSAGKWKSILEKIKYVPLIEDNQKPNNIFLMLRRLNDYQQQKMAEIVGVDVKKLRDLEKGRSLPDSELLCRLYDFFGIPPAVILKDKRGLESEISIFLEMLNADDRKEILEVIKALHNMS